jgi:hypothetical protein
MMQAGTLAACRASIFKNMMRVGTLMACRTSIFKKQGGTVG